MTRQNPVLIQSGDAVRGGEFVVSVFTRRERWIRAMLIWGGCWLLAILVLPIPVVHLFLAPICAVAGPILAYVRYRNPAAAERVTGICPIHGESVSVVVTDTARLPLWIYCPVCNAPWYVTSEGENV